MNNKMQRIYIILLAIAFLYSGLYAQYTSYTDLRGLSGTAGDTVTITTTKIAGSFSFSSTDPNGNGDDNGIVIAAANGFWVRDFAHTLADPIQLDWFELSANENITTLMSEMAQTYSPYLYMRVPTTSIILQMDYMNFNSLAVRRFALLESDAAVTIKQTGTDGEMWFFENMEEFIIGTNVKKASRDDYNLTFYGNWAWDNRYQHPSGSSMIRVRQNVTTNNSFYFRANVKYSKGGGLSFGGTKGAAYYYISGVFDNSAFSINAWDGVAVLEDVYTSDTVGYGPGWKGDAAGNTASGPNDTPSVNVRCRNIFLIYVDQIIGSVEMAYGKSYVQIQYVDKIGTGPDDPFVIKQHNFGYTGPNDFGLQEDVPLRSVWYGEIGMKYDGVGDVDESGQRFLKYIEERDAGYTKHPNTSLFIESASCDDVANCNATIVSHIDHTLVNLGGHINGTGAGGHPGDDIHHITYAGDGVNPAILSPSFLWGSNHDTVKNGQFHKLGFRQLGNGRGGTGNTVKNVTLWGMVEIKNDVTNTALTNVTWLGSAREVMTLASGSDVTAQNLCAPNGSTISGSGQLTLNGESKTLPYTLQAGDCLKPVPDIPPKDWDYQILSIATQSLPDASLNQAYSQTLTASGGTSPYTWHIVTEPNKGLPDGLSLNGAGEITGTPTNLGSFSFNVLVTDSMDHISGLELSIDVVPSSSVLSLMTDKSGFGLQVQQQGASFTCFRVSLKEAGPYHLQVYNVFGKKVWEYKSDGLSKSQGLIRWNNANAANGIYWICLDSGGVKRQARLLLVR